MKNSNETEIKKLVRSTPTLQGLRFDCWAEAGRLLSKKGPEAAIEFMKSKGVPKDEFLDFQPPVKVNIVDQSRSFEEWPIYRAQTEIHRYFCGLTRDELTKLEDKVLNRGLTREEFDATDPGTSVESHRSFFETTGVNNHGYSSVQGLNKIFKNVRDTYEGVFTKVANRNDKKFKRVSEWNEKLKAQGLTEEPFEEESAVDELGNLINPPGVNHNILCYQSCSLALYDPTKLRKTSLLKIFDGYSRDPNEVIPEGVPDRFSIPEGEPGHIPWHQRLHIPEGQLGYVPGSQRLADTRQNNSGIANPKKKGRIRKWYGHGLNYTQAGPPTTIEYRKGPKGRRRNKRQYWEEDLRAEAHDCILATLQIGDDWVALDLRGLLRDVHRRGLVPKDGITAQKLLNMFSQDPVIDPKRGIATLIYGSGLVQSKRVTRGKKTKELLIGLTSQDPIALIGVDLGQTEPVGARVFVVRQLDGDLVLPTLKCSHPLTSEDSTSWKIFKNEIQAYRKASDGLATRLRQEAIDNLTDEQQAEVRLCETSSAKDAKHEVCNRLGIDPSSVTWEKMTPYHIGQATHYIADKFVENGGDRSLVEYIPYQKKKSKKAPKPTLRSDYNISRLDGIRPKLSPGTRKALNEAIRAAQKSSDEYQRLSKRKLEFSRSVVNYLVRKAKKLTGLERVVFVIEDLKSLEKFFTGSGKRDIGWDNFFLPKRENRWFIPAFHKAFSELGTNRGEFIIEVNPVRTSITCPTCSYCDGENRRGTRFKCKKCGSEHHTDLEVAPLNIALIAVTGETLPKCEQSSDKKNHGGARRSKPMKTKSNTSKSSIQPEADRME